MSFVAETIFWTICNALWLCIKSHLASQYQYREKWMFYIITVFFIFFKKQKSEQQFWNAPLQRNRGYLLFSLIFTLGAIEYAWMDKSTSVHVLRLNFTVNTMAKHFILIQYNRKNHFCFQAQIILQLDSNLITLSLLSLMLTFNFSVGRFVYFFEFWPGVVASRRSVCDLWFCISGFSPLYLCIRLKTNRESLL